MRLPFLASLLLLGTIPGTAQETAAALEKSVYHLSLDPNETYRVRDVRLRKGDVSLYFNDGVICFAAPVSGHYVAAVFTGHGVDAPDAELLLMPPQAAERASLASFIKTPNMDEHFVSAAFFFTDGTRDEILKQIADREESRAPAVAQEILADTKPVLEGAARQVGTRMLQSLLQSPDAENSFFFGLIAGRQVGVFDFMYEPSAFEPIIVGAFADKPERPFQLWTAYRPRSMPPFELRPSPISNYEIDARISPDLFLTADAKFDWSARASDGRALALKLSRRLNIEAASIEGKPAKIIQDYSPDFAGLDSDSEVLLVSPEPLTPDRTYRITVRYTGSVIRQVSETSYFVGERNVWYPHTTPMLTTFDLTFHCPARFQLVATGDLVSDETKDGIRTVRRRTQTPQQLAGFNLGEYQSRAVNSGPYHIECYSDASAATDMNNIPQQCERIVQNYTRQWSELPVHTLAVTPIPGYFGQGFPGLIYLSTAAYVPEKDRPAEVRNARANSFFSDLLLPHEVAHQWWGNLVSAASYREDWIMESMANYSALQLVEEEKGREALDEFLSVYRTEVTEEVDGVPAESMGPVDFGVRLLSARNERIWHTVVYEKGTWIMHMLHERLGDAAFRKMQASMLKEYAGKPITNEQFREEVSKFVPSEEPDRSLNAFFETWVYGTGVPRLAMNKNVVKVSRVDDEFTADVPLRCKTRSGASGTEWLRIVAGENPVPAKFGSCQLPAPADFLFLR